MKQSSAGTTVPAADPNTLYRFFAADDTLLYIGITADLATRLRAHNKTKEDFRQVAYIRLEHFDSREEVIAAEIAAIRDERPKWNRVHNNNTVARTGDPSKRARPRVPLPTTHVAASKAAAMLEVASRTTVANYVRQGLLRAVYTTGGQRRLELASITELKEALAVADVEARTRSLQALKARNAALAAESMRQARTALTHSRQDRQRPAA